MSSDKAEKGQSVSMKEWSADLLSHGFTRTQLDKLVLDYLVTEGYKDAAEKFVKEAKLKDCETMVDSDSLEKRLKIRRAIEQGDIREAIRLINDPYPELLDSNRVLHFRLQQQFVIELIRERKVEEAIEQAQTMLVEKADEDASALEQLERTLALLAYDSPSDSPFGDLLAQAHRQAVASDVNAALNALEHRAAASRLSALVRLLAFVHSELDAKYVRTPRLVDVATGRFDQDGSAGRGSSPTACGVSSTTVPK